jgi:hypothetical protein
MRQLPKPEYRVMQRIVAQYGLRDVSEAFAVALHLLTIVERFTLHGNDAAGKQWITQAIDILRTAPESERMMLYGDALV